MSKGTSGRNDAAGLTPQLRRFVEDYRIDRNGVRAYKATHPKCKSVKAAAVGASKLLRKPNVAAALAALEEKVIAGKIAQREERHEFLTTVMRGGVNKTKDRLKANELLARAQGDFANEHADDAATILARIVERSMGLGK